MLAFGQVHLSNFRLFAGMQLAHKITETSVGLLALAKNPSPTHKTRHVYHTVSAFIIRITVDIKMNSFNLEWRPKWSALTATKKNNSPVERQREVRSSSLTVTLSSRTNFSWFCSQVLVHNSLPYKSQRLIRLLLDTPHVKLLDYNRNDVKLQVNPTFSLYSGLLNVTKPTYEVAFRQ